MGVDLRLDGLSFDGAETVSGEEVDFKGEAEDSGDADVLCVCDESIDEGRAHSSSMSVRGDGEGADLGEVFPHDMERAATQELTLVGVSDDAEFSETFVISHGVFSDEDALSRIGSDQVSDARHVFGGGAAHDEARWMPSGGSRLWGIGMLHRGRVSEVTVRRPGGDVTAG